MSVVQNHSQQGHALAAAGGIPPELTRRRHGYSSSDPTRRAAGWSVVVAVHFLVGWALISGTARRGLEIIKKPLEAVVIQEVIIPPPPPPPPPKKIKPPEPKTPKIKTPPPPPFVPPPEVTPPPTAAPAIESTQVAPTAPVVIAPPPPPEPAPAAPSRAEIGVACPTQVRPEMPRKAIREHIEGVVKAQALIRGGSVREVTILSGPHALRSAVRNAMLQYRCVAGSGEILATQEFVFKIE